MSEEPKITHLANEIRRNTGLLADYFTAKDLPFPSLDASAALSVPIPEDELELQKARVSAIEACEELRALLMGPRELLAVNVYSPHRACFLTHIIIVDCEYESQSSSTIQTLSNFPSRRPVIL